jgi:hypothetical protein
MLEVREEIIPGMALHEQLDTVEHIFSKEKKKLYLQAIHNHQPLSS